MLTADFLELIQTIISTPKFKKETFTNEVLSFAKGATEKDGLFWNNLRPVPLTSEEKNDYLLKDSIKEYKKI